MFWCACALQHYSTTHSLNNLHEIHTLVRLITITFKVAKINNVWQKYGFKINNVLYKFSCTIFVDLVFNDGQCPEEIHKNEVITRYKTPTLADHLREESINHYPPTPGYWHIIIQIMLSFHRTRFIWQPIISQWLTMYFSLKCEASVCFEVCPGAVIWPEGRTPACEPGLMQLSKTTWLSRTTVG